MNDQNTIYINKNEINKQKVKDQIEEIEHNEEKLNKLVQRSSEHIFEAQAVFPFDLFPDKIIIDANKVTITRNSFLMSDNFPIPAGEITNIEAYYGVFLASIRIEVVGYSENPPYTSNFTHKDTTLIKRYVVGLIRAQDERIDLSGMELKELRAKLQAIGKQEGDDIIQHD